MADGILVLDNPSLVINPNFFIVGTTKGGSSTLQLWLGNHPEICMTKPKELHFLCNCPAAELNVVSDWREYLSRFTECTIRGEASPCYLYEREAAKTIARRFPESRILVSLRDPVERFWSHYLMNEVYLPTGKSPEAVLADNLASGHSNAITDLFGMGLYADQLGRYLRSFGRDRVHVTFLENLAREPDRELEAILNFLNVPILPLDTATKEKQYVVPRGSIGRFFLWNPPIRRIGVTFIPTTARRFLRTRVLGDPSRKPAVPANLQAQLRGLYAESSDELEAMLGEELPWRWHRKGALS